MKLFTAAWDIGYRKKSEEKCFTIVKTGYRAWAADPFLYEWNGDAYLFAEYWEYTKNRGSLAVCKPNDETPEWSVIIKEPYHLSYPHIFSFNGSIFMCPEANESNSIYLYEATNFPHQWKKHAPLLKNIRAVDTTFFLYEDQTFCFTFDLEKKSLLLFKANLSDMTLIPIPENPIDTDMISARMAGNILIRNHEYIRVSQDCQTIYGRALMFHKFQIEWPKYKEQFIKQVNSSEIQTNSNKKYYGIHTFNESSHYEVIDLKYNHFNLLEFYYRIKRKLSKIL